MTDSYMRIESLDQGTREKPFDFIHLNSVAKDEAGNYLTSGRNLHAILYIDGKTGDVIWTLGGKDNNFMDLSGGHILNMAWQHDAIFVPREAFPKTYSSPSRKKGMTTRLMTIFDNAALDWNYEYGPPYSRGLLMEVTFPSPGKSRTKRPTGRSDSLLRRSDRPLSDRDFAKVKEIDGSDHAYTVRIIQEFIHPQHVRSSTQGSVQTLSQGRKADSDLLVGYGINPVITEFSSNGTVVCDMHFGSKSSWEIGDVQSYRAYKFPWTGRPRYRPLAKIRREIVYVSWNGATDVRVWLLQASDGVDGKWIEVAKVAKAGFETAVPLLSSVYQASGRYIRLLAIDGGGQICEHGISSAIDRSFFGRLAGPGSLRPISGDSMLLTVALVSVICAAILAFFVRLLRRRLSSSRVKAAHHAD